MMEAIKGAQNSIYLESFILTDDKLTHEFFEILKNKARAGVKVKIILDFIGQLWWGAINKNKLRHAGAEVLFFKRLFYRTHRKILVIDEKVAFIGGVNVGGQYAKWLDLHLKIEGTLAKKIAKSFGRIYKLAGGKDASVTSFKTPKATKTRRALYKAKSWLLEHLPIKGKWLLKKYYLNKLKSARESVTIVTPYFVPHRWLMNALKKAAHRGVRVEIILPTKTDIWLANVANWSFAKILSDSIKFLFLPEMVHAKVLLVDNKEGLVGSNNIDAQSFDLNLEASLIFKRKDMVMDLRRIVERWKKSAIPLEAANKPWRWYHKLFAFLSDY